MTGSIEEDLVDILWPVLSMMPESLLAVNLWLYGPDHQNYAWKAAEPLPIDVFQFTSAP